MNRVLSLLALSRPARLFFYATALVHVLFKVLLGLTLVFDDHYGLRSMLAPPQSLVLASGDIATAFLFAKLLDLARPLRESRVVAALCYAGLWVFLVTNFIVHTYFKAFVNVGLLAFNGASSVEISDYALAGVTRYSGSFAVLSFVVLACVCLFAKRLLETRLVARRDVPTYLLLGSIPVMIYASTLSAGQSGFMARNPAYELARSYAMTGGREYRTADAAEARAFETPRPLYGRYDLGLDVNVPSQRGKNVLFVLIESLPFEQTPLGGAEGGLSVLGELAADGVTFKNFRTVFPATSRSFLTYHCGIYPTTGAAAVTKYLPGYRCESIVDVAHARGYRTGFFTAPMFTYDNLHKSKLVAGYDVYEDFLTLRERSDHGTFYAPAVEEEAVTRALVDFIDTRDARPFFATYFMFWNHSPYRLPDEDISALPALPRYRRTLAYLDRVLRDLLRDLKTRGVLDDTLLVVAADHGEGFALHHDNKNHVGHIFEDDVRIPFVVHVPGLGHHESNRQASNVDVAPTLAALLGFPRAPSWQGQDLLGAQFEARPTLLFGRASFATNGIVDGQYKFIEYLGNDQAALYDLSSDPHEQHDLSATLPDRVAAYRALAERWTAVADYRALELNAAAPSAADEKRASAAPLGLESRAQTAPSAQTPN